MKGTHRYCDAVHYLFDYGNIGEQDSKASAQTDRYYHCSYGWRFYNGYRGKGE